MNKEIYQLATTAGLYVDLNGRPYPQALSAEQADAAFKKFVELLVWKCVLISRSSTDGFSAGRRMENYFSGEL
jgi:hypothetical protein